MAEAAIFHLVQTFEPFIHDEFGLLREIKEDMMHIRDKFLQMISFLEVAESYEEGPLKLSLFVRQVREVAYETGDILEQFTLRLNRRNGHETCGFVCKAYYVLMTFRVHHQVANELHRIKSILGDISQEYERHHILYDNIEQGSSNQIVPKGLWYDYRGDALLIEDHETVGIERPQYEIIEWLKNKNECLQVLSVVGMGGIGKTTLVKKVFDNIEKQKIFETQVWITVSKTYKVEELLRDIIRQLFEKSSIKVSVEVNNMEKYHLTTMINDFLRNKRYLLVLDDVWHTHSWQSLRYAFPDSNCGSRVLLTTRKKNVADLACIESHGLVFKLYPLSAVMARTLFCLKAFQGLDCPRHLERISGQILRKCEGLPLAIVAMGGLLSTKDPGSIYEWHMVYRTLGAELEEHGNLQNLQKVLLLSYNDLPYNLKLCFLYMSIYPENYVIDHWRLVRLLIAEGFVEQKQGMTTENVATDYLMELANRSLILVKKKSMNGTVKSYHIHSIFRETIMLRSMKQNLATIVGAQQENNWPKKIRRLSIHDGFQNWRDIKDFIKQLRSLVIFGSIDEMSALDLQDYLGKGARLLKVLDFSGSSMTTLLEKTMRLPHMKYLSLRGTKIKEIPKSIGNLQMLETLDLKGTLVTVLPNEITKLRRLRHLLVYRYVHSPFNLLFDDQIGFKALKGLGNFICLQKLCSIELNQGFLDKTIIIEIGKLTQLRRIHILKVRSEDARRLCSSLEKLRDLRSLTISANNADEIINLEPLPSPPHFLQTLVIKGRLEEFPHWISSLYNVTQLNLRYSKLKGNPLKPLEDLPNLAKLLLEQAYDGESMLFKAGGFRKLKKLVLNSLIKLRQVVVIEGAMPQLEKLHIFGSALMNELPLGIESLCCLKDLQLINMPALVSSLNRNNPSGDYHRIAHISKVVCKSYEQTRS